MSSFLAAGLILLLCQSAVEAQQSAPALAYLTNFGDPSAITTDSAGNVYVAGRTADARFPLVNPLRRQLGEGNCSDLGRAYRICPDAFVAKIDPTGMRLVYSTYLGGFCRDEATGIAVDRAGNIYVSGNTDSGDFPGAKVPTPSRVSPQTFVLKISPAGNLVYSRLFPGAVLQPFNQGVFPARGMATAIAADDAGNGYMAGTTEAADFPTINALQSKVPPLRNGFIAKLDPAGNVLWSTLLGGSQEDEARALAVDTRGDVWVAGTTNSDDFQVVGALQANRSPGGAGNRDAFIARISGDGSRLLNSTFLGGPGDDAANALAIDAKGDVYIGGKAGPGFPVTPGVIEPAGGSGSSGFVAKLDSSAQRLLYSTYVDRGYISFVSSFAPAEDGSLNLAVCFTGRETLVSPLYRGDNDTVASINGDGAFLGTLNPQATAFTFYTPFFGCGGQERPVPPVIARAPSGSLWVAGPPQSPLVWVNGPEFAGEGLERFYEGYVARIDFTASHPDVTQIVSVRNAAGYQLGEVFPPGTLGAIFGDDLARTTLSGSLPLPNELGGVSISIAGAAVPLLYVSPGQINFQVPFETPPGTAALELRRDGQVIATRRIRIAQFAPGLFTQSGDGRGDALVMHASDFRLVTAADPAIPGEPLALYATGLGPVTNAPPSGEPSPPAAIPLVDGITIRVSISGRLQTVLYAGLAPGLAGVYQVNFVFDPQSSGPNQLRIAMNDGFSVAESNIVNVYSR